MPFALSIQRPPWKSELEDTVRDARLVVAINMHARFRASSSTEVKGCPGAFCFTNFAKSCETVGCDRKFFLMPVMFAWWYKSEVQENSSGDLEPLAAFSDLRSSNNSLISFSDKTLLERQAAACFLQHQVVSAGEDSQKVFVPTQGSRGLHSSHPPQGASVVEPENQQAGG